MKKFLILEKTNSIIVFASAFFAVSFFIHSFLKFDLFLYASGFFLALYVPGIAIINIFKRDEYWLNKLLMSPVFTIFIFIPLYYALTLFLGGKINFPIAIASICAITLLSLIITCGKTKNLEKNTAAEDKKFLYFGIGAFILVHLLTTLAYRFIPEVDGYTDLAHIENILSSGVFNISYRPLFSLLVSYVSLVSQIPPYWLFKFGMIVIQMSGIYYLYQITKIADIRSTWSKYLILLTFVSVPIINLETDYVRPNIIFIFALLPFIYYLSRGIDGLKINFIYSSVIATAGLLFHEFFGILFLINLFFIVIYFYKKFNNIKKLIFISILGILLLVSLINIDRFPVLMLPVNSIGSFATLISKGLHWKWWFLGNYVDMGRNNLGWTGFADVSKYYAYSLSPFLAFILFTSIFVAIGKMKKNEKIFSIEKIAFLILFVGLFFAEILPRIDFKTLPDRFWPMISMSLIALAPFTFSKIKSLSRNLAAGSVFVLLLIGISGSVYIAKAKSGYISEKEYSAAQWIRINTQKNSLFITQGENGVILNYFAKRKIVIPYTSFFLDNNDTHQSQTNVPSSENIYKNTINLFNASLIDPNDNKLFSLNSSIRDYHAEIEKEKLEKNVEIPEFKLPDNENIYVLYSLDKFNNYYGQRQWWRDANFYGANLDKFKEGYDLVYNDDNTVFIWKKR